MKARPARIVAIIGLALPTRRPSQGCKKLISRLFLALLLFGPLLVTSPDACAQVYEKVLDSTQARQADFENGGSFPQAGLIEGNDGNLYGMTRFGGELDLGTVFKVTPIGALTTLVEFTDNGPENKGVSPDGGLILVGGDTLYGTTRGGGANGAGTIFKMTPADVLTTLLEADVPLDSSTGGRVGWCDPWQFRAPDILD